MLNPITLLEAAKGKSFGILSDQPDLLDGRGGSCSSRCSGGGYKLNPPSEAAVQPAAEVQLAVEIQPDVLANDVRYRTISFSCWLDSSGPWFVGQFSCC